jgi:hypothetical protein
VRGLLWTSKVTDRLAEVTGPHEEQKAQEQAMAHDIEVRKEQPRCSG